MRVIESENGATIYWTEGMFVLKPWKAMGVPCSDGKRRTVYFTAIADTFFSIPCRCKVGRKTVSGVYSKRGFTPMGANRELIQPEWPCGTHADWDGWQPWCNKCNPDGALPHEHGQPVYREWDITWKTHMENYRKEHGLTP